MWILRRVNVLSEESRLNAWYALLIVKSVCQLVTKTYTVTTVPHVTLCAVIAQDQLRMIVSTVLETLQLRQSTVTPTVTALA